MIQQLVDRIQAFLDAGKLTREQLEVRLEKEDLAFFDGGKILPTLWYPVAQNHRLLELYYDLSGRRDDVMVEMGREQARQILRTPSFAKLFEAAGQRDEASAGHLLVKLAELVLNFSRWTFHGSSLADFRIEVSEATDYSDHARHSATGFMEVLCEEIFGKRVRIASERPAPDRILFRPSGAA